MVCYATVNGISNNKEYFNLRRVKVRTKLTEILYIFFGIHKANVAQLADRLEQRVQLATS